MTAKNLQNFKDYLQSAGFDEQQPEKYVRSGAPGSAYDRRRLPWEFKSWVVHSGGSELAQREFKLELKRESLLDNIKDLFRENYSSFRVAGLHNDVHSGFWLLFEFLDLDLEADQSRLIEEEGAHPEQLPHGLAGVHVSLMQNMGQLTLFMTRHFLLGNVPGKMFIEFPRLLSRALFGHVLTDLSHHNGYIATIDSEEIGHQVIAELGLPSMEEAGFDPSLIFKSFAQIRLQNSAEAWSLEWSHESDLPDLVIPPIEVLEQKEVSRRFQNLDEQILMEDYAQALQTCLAYLEKSPTSLYLIRRLAFICLWTGSEFSRNHLEILSKYDPFNHLALSLWIRRCAEEQQAESLLEYLSKLGNSLGQNIDRFEQADITSLTLPEMLGDAWNVKDDQRAVACYERVLQARGEIPRILVKLIRLMRDLEDSGSEELYMDRLLACEVPVRTRAAIYFRLAEIKQTVDQAEAAQWALKSWQTNRSQVRYALLAANLLTSLGRAHEAVHVLVETSEHLKGHETLKLRLELEMRIASIWLHDLNRNDLAAERIGRARELNPDDPIVLDQLANLAEKLGDADLHIDLLLQTLEAASRHHAEDVTQRAIKSLVELAEKVETLEQQALIYSRVLRRSLIDAKTLESIIANTELKLPYAEILMALEKQIQAVSPESAGPYLQLMGDISLRFLSNPERAREFYEKAVQTAYISSEAFDFLDQIYAAEGMIDQRYGLLKKRLELAPPQEKSAVLRELFYFDEGVSESERDSYALQIFLTDREDTGPFEERISIYEHQGAVAGITSLIEQLLAKSPHSKESLPLIDRAIQALQTSHYEGRYRLMDAYFQVISSVTGLQAETARRALQSLWSDPDKTYVKPYLETLLAAGEIPEVEPDEMLALLSDEQTKVNLLINLANVVSENRAIGYLRRAFRLSKQLDLKPPALQTIIHRLAELTLLQEDELGESIKIVRLSGKSLPILRVLGHQILFAQDETSRGKLAELASEFLKQGISEAGDLDVLRQSIGSLTREQQIGIKVAWFNAMGWDDGLHTKEFVVAALTRLATWDHQEATLIFIDRLQRDWDDEALTLTLLASAFKMFAEHERLDLARIYADKLGSILSFPIHMINFEFFLKQRDLVRAERTLTTALSKDPRPEVLALGLIKAQQLSIELNAGPWLQTLLSELVDPNRMPAPSPEVVKETTFFYARWLVLLKKDMRKALGHLEYLYKVNPLDARYWGPLIVLYREFNADTDLYELLYRTLPRLRQQPEVLQPYHLELASLELDLKTMGQSLGLMGEQTEVTFKGVPADFQSDVSTELDKVGPSGTHVAQAFDQRELPTVARDLNLPPPVRLGISEMSSDTDKTEVGLRPDLPMSEDSFSVSRFMYNQGGDQFSSLTKPSSAAAGSEETSIPLPPGPGRVAFAIQLDEDTVQSLPQTESARPRQSSPKVFELRLDDEGSATQEHVRIDKTKLSELTTRRLEMNVPDETQMSPPDHHTEEGMDRLNEQTAFASPSSWVQPSMTAASNLPPMHTDAELDRPPGAGDTSASGERYMPPQLPLGRGLSLEQYAEPVTTTTAKALPTPASPTSTVPPMASDTAMFSATHDPETALKDRNSHLRFEVEDWRLVSSQAQAKDGLCSWLFKFPCVDKAEQHVALQVTALFEDKPELLENWEHKVWRQPNDLFYDLRWTDRMGREMFHPGVKTPLARLIKALMPVINFQHLQQLSLRGIAERLKVRPEEILRVRRPIEWKDELIQRSCLRFYTKYLIENKFQMFHLPKLEDRLHFDFEKREIYLDRDHYMQVPSSHLFHRIAFLSRALHLEFYSLLQLSPQNDIYPLLLRCRRSLEQSRGDNVRRMLGIEKDPLRVFLSQTDRDQLEALFKEAGLITVDKVVKICGAYIEQIYRINLAETLDVVGIFESITSVDISRLETKPTALVAQFPVLRSVLAFAADLRFGQKPPA